MVGVAEHKARLIPTVNERSRPGASYRKEYHRSGFLPWNTFPVIKKLRSKRQTAIEHCHFTLSSFTYPISRQKIYFYFLMKMLMKYTDTLF